MGNPLFAKKPLQMLLDEAASENRLRRCLGPVTLTSLGVGAIIGTGIFVVTGIAAHDKTGPALVLSFAAAGLACVFAALCYAEFASLTPVAGSAYTYAYATMGELFAWIMGWDLVLEYSVSLAAVAHGWSHYFQSFIGVFGFKLPFALTLAPFDYFPDRGVIATTGTAFDLPAMVIVALITILLVKGIKESATVNSAIVITKVGVVLLVIVVGAFYINPANWHPFAPFGFTGVSLFGHTLFGQTGAGGEPLGMLAGAAMIFFAYIGFDSLSTHAEEAKNPKRDIPIGIISSLIICAVLYIAVSLVLTGMVPYNKINIDAPVSDAFGQVGLPVMQFLVSLGAIAGITSVLLVMELSQPRILLAMARDGLIPQNFFGAIHPKFRTPWKATILTGALVALGAAFLPLRIIAELVNIGTLLAFVMVCAAVLIMRRTHPDAPRSFKVPFYPWLPILGILTNVALMFSLPEENWLRLAIWLAIGLLIYFGYSRKHSVMAQLRAQSAGVYKPVAKQ
jgi:APA family basic amino acid/polyamine antiporter